MPVRKPKQIEPYWSTSDNSTVKLYLGDVLETLRKLPSKSVHCVVTSPPYWRLRDYQGEEKQLGSEKSLDCLGWANRVDTVVNGKVTPKSRNCAEVDWENGCHVCRMVIVFREVRRVLRDDGTLWLNYGDSYVNGNLTGVPWRVALALQADGWILRQDIIWAKPSPMPESAKNRCTKAHEYVFLFAKKGSYYYDQEAIKEPPKTVKLSYEEYEAVKEKLRNGDDTFHASRATPKKSNRRSVWNITSEAYPGAHFATFPKKLITPMIKAGTSEKGCCKRCLAPLRRIVSETPLVRERPNDHVKRRGEEGTGNSCPNSVEGVETRTLGWEPICECFGRFEMVEVPEEELKEGVIPKGWAVGEGSHDKREAYVVKKNIPRSELVKNREKQSAKKKGKTKKVKVYISEEEIETTACVVLDPFMGTGTTAQVALSLGRRSVGIELSEEYLVNNAIPRISGEIASRPSLSHLLNRKHKPLVFGEKNE